MKSDTHCLDKFHFCPVCGSSDFEENDFKSKYCLNCGFTFYLNAAASVVGILFDEMGKILVARRAFDPAKDTLDFPGGFVDFGETLEQALLREMKEETSLNVTVDKWLFSVPNTYLYSGFNIPTIDNFFLCHADSTQGIKENDDVSELFWMPLKDLNPMDFGLKSMQKAIPLLLNHFRYEF